MKRLTHCVIGAALAGGVLAAAPTAQAQSTDLKTYTSSPAVTAHAIWPYVPGHGDDTTTLRTSIQPVFDANGYVLADQTVYVVNGDGKRIRNLGTVTLATQYQATHLTRWVWDGKTNGGKLAQLGGFTFTSKVHADGYTTVVTDLRPTVHVKHATMTRHQRYYDNGRQTASRHIGRSCFATPGYPHGLDIDCWGGTATVTYTGPLTGQHVRDIHWWVHGDRGCCSNGRVIKRFSHTARHYKITVTVTNWAEYTVTQAGVRFAYSYTR